VGGMRITVAAVADPTSPTRARRAWWLIAALLLGLGAAPIVAAPGVAATCERVVALVEATGEPVDGEGRAACEVRYAQLRGDRGPIGWAWVAWCTRLARTVDEAGEC
jgi:hypothetical protein